MTEVDPGLVALLIIVPMVLAIVVQCYLRINTPSALSHC